jgi:hypothetical protein
VIVDDVPELDSSEGVVSDVVPVVAVSDGLGPDVVIPDESVLYELSPVVDVPGVVSID